MTDSEFDSLMMAAAMEQSSLGIESGDVPVGAIVVLGRDIVGRGHNRCIPDHDPTAHAEVMALRDAAAKVGNHRLTGATLYVTLEPCVMCAGAILHARIERLVYAAPDPRFGAAGSALNLLDSPFLNHRAKVTAGVMREEASAMLEAFFAERR